MPTYIYEIVPDAGTNRETERFEVRQSMSEAPLTTHPDTGRPIRRVITGGRGPLTQSHGVGPSTLPPLSGGCGSGCNCH